MFLFISIITTTKRTKATPEMTSFMIVPVLPPNFKKVSRIVYIIIPIVKKAMIKIIKFLIKFLICFFFKSGDMTSLKKNFQYNSELQISHFGKTYFPLVLLISITSVNHFFMHS